MLALEAKGTSNRAIAPELFISEATAQTQLTHSYGKLGVKDTTRGRLADAQAASHSAGALGGSQPCCA
ncbi:response regulator transcription factor [Streptomyces sp. G44]|nr:response regulator transcription factor [Streptomyces sp. G44]